MHDSKSWHLSISQFCHVILSSSFNESALLISGTSADENRFKSDMGKVLDIYSVFHRFRQAKMYEFKRIPSGFIELSKYGLFYM